MARPERLRGFDQALIDVARTALGIDKARGKRSGEYDQHRAADPGAEPQRREGHPCNRSDEAQCIEQRRNDRIEPAKPPDGQPKRHADHHSQAKTHPEADE